MSTNFNRSSTKNITTNREYKLIRYNWKEDRYNEEYGKLKTNLWPVQYRSYRTWKYNRKKQYKQK